jgi:MPBQ/MSBQ methyltransferase
MATTIDIKLEEAAMPTPTHYEHILDYYRNASRDYESWSKQFNMHFGYYRWGLNPFRREGMLNEMNEKVFDQLAIDDTADEHVYDLGCGLGGTLRHSAKRFNSSRFTGFTLVPWQVEHGNAMLQEGKFSERINMLEGDYTKLSVPSNSAAGVYNLESACHAKGSDKAALVKEVHRVLKPGQRYVVADGFMINPSIKQGKLMKRAMKAIGENWAVEEFAQLEHFEAALLKQGFIDVTVKDISWNIAPSVLHAPFTVLGFVLKKLWKREKMEKQSINNLKGSLLSLVVGMNRSKFRYCIVTATKA